MLADTRAALLVCQLAPFRLPFGRRRYLTGTMNDAAQLISINTTRKGIVTRVGVSVTTTSVVRFNNSGIPTGMEAQDTAQGGGAMRLVRSFELEPADELWLRITAALPGTWQAIVSEVYS